MKTECTLRSSKLLHAEKRTAGDEIRKGQIEVIKETLNIIIW